MNTLNDSNIKAIVKGNTAFALDLYKKLKECEGNLFFSPYSISAALAMTYAGTCGNTKVEIARTLHFTLDQKRLHPAFASLEASLNAVHERGNIQLSIANSLWPQEGYDFLREFLTLAKKHYGVSITLVDYQDAEAAREKINLWVEKNTDEKIKDLIAPGVLDALTRLVLTNAICFKGSWASQFDETLTKDASFWVMPDNKVQVPMMTQEQRFGYTETDNLQILELPYVGNDLSLIILLPKEVDGLGELENTLTEENLNKWISRLWQRKVLVFLPKFKMNSRFRLDGTLKSMGMIDAFDQSKANFSAMDGRANWLYIAAVIHQAFVNVNEEGTEAAAATAVVMRAKSMPSPPANFRADHPFIFLIRENLKGSLLFFGRVTNPSEQRVNRPG